MFGLDTAVHRPWLSVADQCSLSYGMLRFPLMGLPLLLYALDDFIGVACTSMELILSKQLSLENIGAWFPEDGKDAEQAPGLDKDDIDYYLLQKGESVMLPFGSVCLWSHIPKDCTATGQKGKVLVQWVLGQDRKTDDKPLSLAEVRGMYGKLMAANGSKRPWSSVKDDLDKWLAGGGEA